MPAGRSPACFPIHLFFPSSSRDLRCDDTLALGALDTRSEMKERSRIAIEIDQPVQRDSNTHTNHNYPGEYFDLPRVRFQPLEQPMRLIKAQSQQQKWRPHSQ